MSQKFVALHIYLSPDRDAAILAWLKGQSSKSAAVREALAVYIQTKPTDNETKVQATIDPQTIYQAMDEALASRLNLDAIRQVVEAAVANTMVGLNLTKAVDTGEEADTILNGLDNSLVVE